MRRENGSKRHKYAIIVHIPFAITEEGLYAVDTLWGWDLEAYTTSGLFDDLLIVSPRDYKYNTEKYPFIISKEISNISFYSLCTWRNYVSSMDTRLVSRLRRLGEFAKQIPEIAYRLWKETPNWDIVHSNATIYPPFGIMANIIGYIRKRKRVFIFDADIESILEYKIRLGSKKQSLALYLVKTVYSNFVKFCIHTSDFTIVLGDALYRRYKGGGNVFKVHASWISEKDIISSEQLEEKLSGYSEKNLNLMVASSLIPEKGVEYAVEAVKIAVRQMGIPVDLDIYGEGPMKRTLEGLIESYELTACVRFQGVIPYGDYFYNTIRAHDCVLVPNLTGELPRILFDALANGAAIIASDIEVLNDVVSDGNNALLFTPGDSTALAYAIRKLHQDRELLRKIACNAAATGRMFTRESRIKDMAEVIGTKYARK